MKPAVAIAVVIVGLAAFLWWRSRSALAPESLFVVAFDADTISVTTPNAEKLSVQWAALTKVGIRTTEDGPSEPDVFWGFHANDAKPSVVFPGGATGESKLLEALQARLPGFNDEQVIKAMSSTSNAYFTVWEKPSADTAK